MLPVSSLLRRRALRVIAPLLCVLLAWLPGCATNPVSGDNEIILMSEEDEQRIGDEAALQIAAQVGIVEEGPLAEYIDELGQRLAAISPRRDVEYSFYIVEMPEPNAFALPGGYIYLTRGLIALANSEAEIANVIGHEIGHVAARHAAQRDTQVKMVSMLTLLGMVGAAAGGGDGRAVGATQFLGQGLMAAYSRSQEWQSDEIAQELTSKSGIDPAGMADFLRSLDSYTRLQRGVSRSAGFFDTHPATPERFAEATTRAQVLRWTPADDPNDGPDLLADSPSREQAARERFLRRLDGLIVGDAAREGVFRENHFLHADLGFALRFPPGWRTFNGRSQVTALSPGRDAIAILQLQGPGSDPRAAAVEYGKREKLVYADGAPIRIGSLPAFRARARVPTGAGAVDAVITWIAYEGRIYRLAAGSLAGSFPKYDGIFRSFARGFRPLREEDRADIGELRLRIVEAEGGETLAELSRRTGNAWNLNETAVHNGLKAGDRLVAGQAVKIARRERYEPEEAPEPAPDLGPQPPVEGPQLPAPGAGR